MEPIVARIKKLLALGQANSGATEHEAASAMSMASALMLKHNIEVQLDDDTPAGATEGTMRAGFDEVWHAQLAGACGYLYSCRPLIWKRFDGISFVGRADNIAACESTLTYLVAEVERLYKMNLPKGMDKSERAEFRRTFKFACSRRIAGRAWAIMEELRQDNVKAITATGSTALVVVESIDQQLKAADEILGNLGVKAIIERPKKAGLGTQLGRDAGNTVELQRRLS